MNREKIIVTMTSWSKRISYCGETIRSILSGTMIPDKLVLNLSTDEFPQKERQLPSAIVDLLKNSKVFEIYWVRDNTKVWKKVLPTLTRFPNDIIIPIDDDIIYPRNYIRTLVSEYINNGRKTPIVCYDNTSLGHGIYSHSGGFSLIKKEFLGDYAFELYTNLVQKYPNIRWCDDEVYTYAVLLNGYRYKFIPGIDSRKLYKDSQINSISPYSNTNDKSFMSGYREQVRLIREYIKSKYHKTFEQLIDSRVVVNMTTWPKREESAYLCLKHFSGQTEKPYKINLWLSKEEYPNGSSPIIDKIKNEHLVDEVRLVPGNTFCHKRWEAVREHPEYFNISIDDDVYYDRHFVEELHKTAYDHQDCAVIWTTNKKDYVGTNRIELKYECLQKGYNLKTLSGLSCYPPYVFPYKSLLSMSDRARVCQKCDDSWINAWLIKCHTPIIGVHSTSTHTWKLINSSLNVGIWIDNKKIENGIQKINSNFAKALIAVNAVADAKKIWPKFNIEKCASAFK